MLDLRRIRQEPEEVARLLAIKHVEANLDEILDLDRQRRALMVALEQLKAHRNAVTQEIAAARQRQQDAATLIEDMRQVGEQIRELEVQIAPVTQTLEQLLLTVPNTPFPDVPAGHSADDNVVVHVAGQPTEFAFEPKPHWELGEQLGILDFERARKIAGSRFTVFRGWGARLSRALINFMLDHARERGYDEIEPPYMVNAQSMVGTGQFPKFQDDVFRLVPHDYYLIPTAEVPLTNLHREEILGDGVLPLKYTAYTASFRAEAGAAGRDTRGLIRQHQFDKVELVRIERPEDSEAALETMLRDAEAVLDALELPYRTVLLCGGDMGFAQAKTYDIEVWMPSYGRYVEISSCSNMGDFQARRADIRYRPGSGKKTEFVHTLNGSALAVGRTMAAIIENRQLPSGHFVVPPVLRPYLGDIDEI